MRDGLALEFSKLCAAVHVLVSFRVHVWPDTLRYSTCTVMHVLSILSIHSGVVCDFSATIFKCQGCLTSAHIQHLHVHSEQCKQ